jgi:hypothetical protein
MFSAQKTKTIISAMGVLPQRSLLALSSNLVTSRHKQPQLIQLFPQLLITGETLN